MNPVRGSIPARFTEDDDVKLTATVSLGRNYGAGDGCVDFDRARRSAVARSTAVASWHEHHRRENDYRFRNATAGNKPAPVRHPPSRLRRYGETAFARIHAKAGSNWQLATGTEREAGSWKQVGRGSRFAVRRSQFAVRGSPAVAPNHREGWL